MAALDTAQDYRNLDNRGGFALDRPLSLEELERAVRERTEVAIRKAPAAGIEHFGFYYRWGGKRQELDQMVSYLESGRLICHARPGDNEGYIVQVLLSPTYFDRGPCIPVAHSKCWSREAALVLLQEVSELMLRW